MQEFYPKEEVQRFLIFVINNIITYYVSLELVYV